MYAKCPGELTAAREISQIYKTPFDQTSRVLQLLAHHEILNSEQGPQGGYQITADLSKVSFLELAEIIMGPVNVVNCLLEPDSGCDIKDTCNIISPIVHLNEKIKDFYANLSLREIIDPEPDGGHHLTTHDNSEAFSI